MAFFFQLSSPLICSGTFVLFPWSLIYNVQLRMSLHSRLISHLKPLFPQTSFSTVTITPESSFFWFHLSSSFLGRVLCEQKNKRKRQSIQHFIPQSRACSVFRGSPCQKMQQGRLYIAWLPGPVCQVGVKVICALVLFVSFHNPHSPVGENSTTWRKHKVFCSMCSCHKVKKYF